MENCVGKKVIIRADRAGVFFGTLKSKDGAEVELLNTRRLWHWGGAASVSELAVNGVSKPSECKFSVAVESEIILGVIEIIPCSEKAIKSIKDVSVWKMSKE